MPITAGVRRFGSAALDLAWVAAGRYDGYWELGLHAWDVAAGALIVREAGGTVTHPDGTEFFTGGLRTQRPGGRQRAPARQIARARSGWSGGRGEEVEEVEPGSEFVIFCQSVFSCGQPAKKRVFRLFFGAFGRASAAVTRHGPV